jgi:hypothetical protein
MGKLEISSGKHDTLVLHTIKAVPAGTVPCRDQFWEEFLFQDDHAQALEGALGLPTQVSHDLEWDHGREPLSWGVYMGHNGRRGASSGWRHYYPEGVPWDAHLQEA